MKTPVRLTVLLLLGCDVLLVMAYLVSNFADMPRLNRQVDLDGEANVAAWYSSMQWLLCALAFGVFALRNVDRAVVRSWPLLLVPALFLAFSLDEVAQIHESLGHHCDVLLEGGKRSASSFPVTGVWMFAIGGPVVALLAILAIAIRPYFIRSRGAWKKLCLGMLVMLSGALGVETLSNYVAEGSGLAIAEIVVEEFLEMLGATIVLWAGVELLAGNGFVVQMDAAGGQRPGKTEHRARVGDQKPAVRCRRST